MRVLFPEPSKILYDLAKETAYRYEKFRIKFPNLKENDIRIGTHGRCANIIESVLFSSIFQKEQLTQQDWYERIPYLKMTKKSQIESVHKYFEPFLMVSFVTNYFAVFELFFRILMKKVEPKTDNDKSWRIIESTLTKFNLKTYQRVFDLHRFIRNSLHSNGIITDKYVYPMIYRGKIYQLQLNMQFQVDWILLSSLSLDMQDCIEKIMNSDTISKIPEIIDPSFEKNQNNYEMYYI